MGTLSPLNPMQKLTSSITAILAVLALVIAIIAVGHNNQPVALGNAVGQYNSWMGTGTATSTAYALGNTSIRVIATSTSASYRIISNGSSYTIFCNISADKAAANHTGIAIAASSTYSFLPDNLYQGSVRCISPSGTANIWVAENSN